MSGDPLELTEEEAQIHEEWRGEEMDSTAEPRTLAIEPVLDTYIGDWLDQENERAAEEMPGRPHEQGSATDVLPVSLTHTADQPRSLRQILFTHRALAAATAVGITELMAEVTAYIRMGQQAVADDARRQRDNARGQDQLFNGIKYPDTQPGQYEQQWTRANPGLVALLQAVDGA